MALLCVGSVAVDDIVTPHGELRGALGGSAVYFSLAARMFTDVLAVGIVGADFPPGHVEFLASAGIDVSGIESSPGRTFRWSGEYAGDMSSAATRSVELGVFGDWKPRLSEAHRRAEYVFLANSSPRTQSAVIDQLERPRMVAADTMNLWIERDRDELVRTLGRVDCLFINDSEARMLARKNNLVSCGKELLSMGPSSVVIKKGEHGSMLVTSGGAVPLPAYPTEDVADPTGAGDSFAGGCMGWTAFAGGACIEGRALSYGTVVASFTVSRFGVHGLRAAGRAEVDGRREAFLGLLASC